MSSETYDLLKRPDEFFIVNKAHHNPKFVEDVVRGILARALDVYADFPRRDVHLGDASELRVDPQARRVRRSVRHCSASSARELRDGVHVDAKTDVATWLGTRPSPVSSDRKTRLRWNSGRRPSRRRAHRCDDACATSSPRRGTTCAPDDARRIAALGVRASRVPVLWERVAPDDPHARDFASRQRRLRRAARARRRADRHAAPPRQRSARTPICSTRRSRCWFAEYAEAAARAVPVGAALDADQRAADDGALLRRSTACGIPNMRDDRAFGRAIVNQTLAMQAAMRRIRARRSRTRSSC